MAEDNKETENKAQDAANEDSTAHEHSHEHNHEHEHNYKKADFVKFDYTAKGTDGNIFDTTKLEVAKEAGLEGQGTFNPLVVPLQKGYLLEGLRKNLEGKKPGHYTFDLEPEEAFGRKDPKLIRLISQSNFRKQDINPYPGMPVKIDEQQGTVRSVSGGRVLVDFNHPMAGRKITYEVDYEGTVDDAKECLLTLLELTLRIPRTLTEVEENAKGDYKLGLKLNEQWPKEALTEIEHMATGMIKGLDKLEIHYIKDDKKSGDDNKKPEEKAESDSVKESGESQNEKTE